MSVAEVHAGARVEGNAYDLVGPLTPKMPTTTPPASVRDWDAKAERRVLWKIDLLLMPVLTFSYGLQFVSDYALIFVCARILTYCLFSWGTRRQYDKFVFSSAAVFGMLNDLHLTTPVPGTNLVSTQRYSTAYAPLSLSTCINESHSCLPARLPSTGATLSACSQLP